MVAACARCEQPLRWVELDSRKLDFSADLEPYRDKDGPQEDIAL